MAVGVAMYIISSIYFSKEWKVSKVKIYERTDKSISLIYQISFHQSLGLFAENRE